MPPVNQYAFGMEYYAEYTVEVFDRNVEGGRTARDICHVDIEDPQDGFTEVLSVPEDSYYLKYAGTITIEHLMRLFSVMLPETSSPPEVIQTEKRGEIQAVTMTAKICTHDDQGYAIKPYARETVLICPIPIYKGETDLPDEVVDSEPFAEKYGVVFDWLEQYPELELMQKKYCPDEMQGFIVDTAEEKKEYEERRMMVREDYLSKKMFMSLPAGLYIESNILNKDETGRAFDEAVLPTKEERELQWKRIKAVGVDQRLCTIYSIEQIRPSPTVKKKLRTTKGDKTISLTGPCTDEEINEDCSKSHQDKNILFLPCPKCTEFEGVVVIPIITDKMKNILIPFESEIDELDPDELFKLCQYLHTVNFICKKCGHVFNYDNYLANEEVKYSKLKWVTIFDRTKNKD